MIFFIIGLLLLASGFYGLFVDVREKDTSESESLYLYGNYFFPAKTFSGGIIAFVLGVYILLSENSKDEMMSWTFFVLGLIFLGLTLGLFFSKKFTQFFWNHIPKKSKTEIDKKAMLLALAVIVFACFFSFFLFYPPFLGIG